MNPDTVNESAIQMGESCEIGRGLEAVNQGFVRAVDQAFVQQGHWPKTTTFG